MKRKEKSGKLVRRKFEVSSRENNIKKRRKEGRKVVQQAIVST